MNNQIRWLLMFVAVASTGLVLPREAFCLPPFLARFQAKYCEKDPAEVCDAAWATRTSERR